MRHTNIIPIEGLVNFACKLAFYTNSHAHMGFSIIPLGADQKSFRIEFSRVVYFSGPTGWKDANFHIAPPNECLNILRQMSTFDEFTDESLMEEYKLFISGTARMEAKVIASNLLLKTANESGEQ